MRVKNFRNEVSSPIQRERGREDLPYTPLFTITLTNYIRNNIAVLQLCKV